MTGLGFWLLRAARGTEADGLFGPGVAGADATVEWVELSSVERVRDVVTAATRDFCA